MSSSDDTITTTITFPKELWRRIRILAAKEDKSAAQWVREAILLVVERSERSA